MADEMREYTVKFETTVKHGNPEQAVLAAREQVRQDVKTVVTVDGKEYKKDEPTFDEVASQSYDKALRGGR